MLRAPLLGGVLKAILDRLLAMVSDPVSDVLVCLYVIDLVGLEREKP